MRIVPIAAIQLLAIAVSALVSVELEHGITPNTPGHDDSTSLVGKGSLLRPAIKAALPSDEQSLLCPSSFSRCCVKVRRLTTESLVCLRRFSLHQIVPQVESTFATLWHCVFGPSIQVLFSIWRF